MADPTGVTACPNTSRRGKILHPVENETTEQFEFSRVSQTPNQMVANISNNYQRFSRATNPQLQPENALEQMSTFHTRLKQQFSVIEE